MDRQRTALTKTSRNSLSIIGIICFIALVGFLGSSFSKSSPSRPSFGNSKMGIVHIVMFEFKEEATADEIADVRLSAFR
jgi:hypothetical protein